MANNLMEVTYNEINNPLDLPSSVFPAQGFLVLSSVDVHRTADLPGEVRTPYSHDIPASVSVRAANTMESSYDITHPPTVIETFGSVKDAWVRESRPTMNYGTGTSLVVGEEEDGEFKTYVGFDIDTSNISAEELEYIISAEIRLYRTFSSEENCLNLNVYETSDDWSETGITWLGQPEQKDLIAQKAVCESDRYISFDIEHLVEEWFLDDPGPRSIMLEAEKPDGVRQYYRARESETLIPQVRLEYVDKQGLYVTDQRNLSGVVRVPYDGEFDRVSTVRPAPWADLDLVSSMQTGFFYDVNSQVDVVELNLGCSLYVNGSLDLMSNATLIGDGLHETRSAIDVRKLNVLSSADVYIPTDIGSQVDVWQLHDIVSTAEVWYSSHLNALADVWQTNDLDAQVDVWHAEDLTSSVGSRRADEKDLVSAVSVREQNVSSLVDVWQLLPLASLVDVWQLSDLASIVDVWRSADLLSRAVVRRAEGYDIVSGVAAREVNLESSVTVWHNENLDTEVEVWYQSAIPADLDVWYFAGIACCIDVRECNLCSDILVRQAQYDNLPTFLSVPGELDLLSHFVAAATYLDINSSVAVRVEGENDLVSRVRPRERAVSERITNLLVWALYIDVPCSVNISADFDTKSQVKIQPDDQVLQVLMSQRDAWQIRRARFNPRAKRRFLMRNRYTSEEE